MKLAATLLFDQPSPERLTEYLAGMIEPTETVSELDGLDAEALAALLEAKLSSMDSGV